MYKVIVEDEDGRTITEANTNMLFVAYDDKNNGPGCYILGRGTSIEGYLFFHMIWTYVKAAIAAIARKDKEDS